MKSLTAYPSTSESLGYFRVYAKPPGGRRREITIFRDAPVIFQNATFADPFTHQTAQMSLPQVTIFDNPGNGDLDWLVPDCDIDVVWQNTGPYQFTWSWEGFIASFNFSTSSFTVDLKGALYGLDDYLAIPSFPNRPIPYEILIAKAFDQRAHPTGLGQFRVLFPTGWATVVPEFDSPEYLSQLKPWGVATGQPWTGFTSRSTGTWEPLLTGHVQSLLSVMFAEGGAQWSVRNIGQRRPELYLRQIPEADDPGIIEINLGAPGVEFTGSQDFSQRASVIYGQGTDEAGVTYSGMVISPDGRTTSYEPFAYSPSVWPRLGNPRYDPNAKAKEVMIRLQDGVDEVSARKVAQGQYQRFSEPGITGSITLTSDVRYADGYLCPRMLIQAGKTIRIKGLYGLREGVLAHITQTSADFQALTMTLEFDTKYRDALTVEEVKARTRDALTPLRKLQVGKYSNTIDDLVLPWSYTEGSGCVPTASRELYAKLPSTATFPYQEWTKKHPPKDPASRPWYVRINPTDVENASNNWAGVPRDGTTALSIPVRMSQKGSIRLTQFAAYDEDGNVLPVRFHVSVYGNPTVQPDAMPRFSDEPGVAEGMKFLRPYGVVGLDYKVGDANPFFEMAWRTVADTGFIPTDPTATNWNEPAKGANLIVGWGNYFEPAGYSPGLFSQGGARTGLLVDDSNWTYSTEGINLDMYSPENNTNSEYAGMLSVMIYCDEQLNQPVYFLGRFFRQESN